MGGLGTEKEGRGFRERLSKKRGDLFRGGSLQMDSATTCLLLRPPQNPLIRGRSVSHLALSCLSPSLDQPDSIYFVSFSLSSAMSSQPVGGTEIFHPFSNFLSRVGRVVTCRRRRRRSHCEGGSSFASSPLSSPSFFVTTITSKLCSFTADFYSLHQH